MEKANKKVICINGDSTKAYEQVIFIMKNEKPPSKRNERVDLVKEAERIINEKLAAGNKAIQRAQVNAVTKYQNGIQQLVIKKKSSFETLLNIMMLVGCVVLALALVYISR